MLPSWSKLTITVMSMSELAIDAGGGFQQRRNRANACLMLSILSGACADAVDSGSSSAAANQMGDLRRGTIAYLISEATCTFTILSGSVTVPLCEPGGAFFSLSATSIPETTSPTTEYFPSRNEALSKQMKNCAFDEFGEP